MRRSTWLVAVGAALAVVAGQAAVAEAQHENSQQAKMTTCNADAKAKGLKGDERKAYMKSCLSEKGAAAPAAAEKMEKAGTAEKGEKSEKLTAQQEKMKSCNADAKAKALKGDERKAFMKDCLKAH